MYPNSAASYFSKTSTLTQRPHKPVMHEVKQNETNENSGTRKYEVIER